MLRLIATSAGVVLITPRAEALGRSSMRLPAAPAGGGGHPAATAAAVFYAISAHVENLAKERLHPVFLLDEAHLLHQDTLDHLHVLLNYEWDSRALLSLILVGLPELLSRLELRKNRSLSSRIHRRLSIGPMTADDTAAYVRQRRLGSGLIRPPRVCGRSGVSGLRRWAARQRRRRRRTLRNR